MMKRRLNMSALLATASLLGWPSVAWAQGGDAAPAEAPKEPEKPAADKPAEGEPAPLPLAPEAKPTEAPTATAVESKAEVAAPTAPEAPKSDQLDRAGYVPGYKSYVSLGPSPFVPRVGALPGGMTPSFSARVPTDDWSFNFSGFMSASVRASMNERKSPRTGQSETVLHAAPTTVDSYQSFQDTGATPGNWVELHFQYGNRYVTANIWIDTYNPTRATSYKSIGSQGFIDNMFLSLRIPPIDRLNMNWNVGYFGETFGNLGQYGGGLYNSPLIGTVRGATETFTAEYQLDDKHTLILEDGFGISPVTGKSPEGVLNSASSNFADVSLPPSFIHHAHAGVLRKGETSVQVMAHLMSNWSQDDQVRATAVDNPDTRQWDESKPRDGHVHVAGVDLKAVSQAYGYFAMGASYIQAKNAFRLRGLTTYAMDGIRISDDWLGTTTGGSGNIWAAAFNYRVSLGSLLRAPTPFWGDAPDLQLETSFHIAGTKSDDEFLGGRIKNKLGLDALYTFLPWVGAGIRGDRVAPNSKDPEETFYAVAARLQFRSNWTSHETVTLKYVKWFYGDNTHGDGWDARPREQLDDQMLGLGFGMWW